MEIQTLTNPPQDHELNTSREDLQYALVYPEAGIGPDTGLLLWVCPWGTDPLGIYSIEKLMPYLANTSDCVVVSAVDHDIVAKRLYMDFPAPRGWAEAMHARYGSPVTEDLNDIYAYLLAHEVSQVDAALELILTRPTNGGYLSWGVLPALDYISVLGKLLNELELNKKKLLLFGSSYGAYVATMILKFMPNTFSLAIENSGFTRAIPHLMANREHSYCVNGTTAGGVSFHLFEDTLWTFKDQSSPYFFKPQHEMIRDVGHLQHMRKSETPLFSFHSSSDAVAPYGLKVNYCTFRKAYGETVLKTVNEESIDGHLFKTVEHGMDASMKAMFDYVTEQSSSLEKDREENDFDDQTKLEFDCGEVSYVFEYQSDGTVQWAVKPVL